MQHTLVLEPGMRNETGLLLVQSACWGRQHF